ncbi:MAG: SDR family oxidoreductase [Anaerolineales bacterium]
MATILITGASGLLGANLARDYAGDHEVWGVFNSHRLSLPGVRMIRADLAEPRQAMMVMGKVKPDLVVHCAAATDIDRCQREPEWAFRLNKDMAENVATAARRNGADLIHISTDAVFDGEAMPYEEGDQAAPVNVYGESKLAGEGAVVSAHPEALVVRTNLFGWNLRSGKKGLAEWFLSNLSQGRSVPGFQDVYFSPLLVNDLGDMLLDLWKRGAEGVLHLGGGDCLSKFDFGRRLAAAFGYDIARVEPSSLEQVGLGAPRAKQLCLDSSKAASILSEPLPTIVEALLRFEALRVKLGGEVEKAAVAQNSTGS